MASIANDKVTDDIRTAMREFLASDKTAADYSRLGYMIGYQVFRRGAGGDTIHKAIQSALDEIEAEASYVEGYDDIGDIYSEVDSY